MADFIRFTKQGLVPFYWNSETREYDPKPNGKNLENLRTRCEIEPGVTLGEIFKAVEADPELAEFVSKYSWCSAIAQFHEQAKLPRPEKKSDADLTEIVIEAYAEYHKPYKDTEEGYSYEGVYEHISGLDATGQHWGISYTPMNEIVHLPVRLVETVTFKRDFEPEGSYRYKYTLLQVLDAIYWDISFHGGPVENAEFVEMLGGMIDDLESGVATTVPFELE